MNGENRGWVRALAEDGSEGVRWRWKGKERREDEGSLCNRSRVTRRGGSCDR